MGIAAVSARRAVFLDRDGVINRNVFDPATGEYGAPRRREDFALAPQVLASLLALQEAGFLLFLVSNQPDYAKGKATLEALASVHDELTAQLDAAGIAFAEFYYCYHHPRGIVAGYSGSCECRKPSPHFLLQARDAFALSLSKSWMVGDRAADVECGRNAGARTIRVAEDHPATRAVGELAADFQARDLAQAAAIILGSTDAMPVTAILAGGLATRLGVLTAAIPKSMLPVGGEPLIAHQLRLLASQGLADVVICVGHLGEQIERFVGDGTRFGCRVRYSFDGKHPLGTGGALRRALPMLGEAFPVIYGDTYLREPYLPVWESFRASGKSALMTILRNDGRWDASNVDLRDGHIAVYDKTLRSPAMRHIDYGLGCIRSEALAAWATPGQPFDLASFYQAMLERNELAAFEVKERFYEIGSPSGLAETDALLAALRGRRGQ